MRLAHSLIAEGVLTEASVRAMEEQSLSDAKAALELASADPWPGAEVIEVDAFAPSQRTSGRVL